MSTPCLIPDTVVYMLVYLVTGVKTRMAQLTSRTRLIFRRGCLSIAMLVVGTCAQQTHVNTFLQDEAIDVFPVAFLNVFFGPGDAPSINLANVIDPLTALLLEYLNLSFQS